MSGRKTIWFVLVTTIAYLPLCALQPSVVQDFCGVEYLVRQSEPFGGMPWEKDCSPGSIQKFLQEPSNDVSTPILLDVVSGMGKWLHIILVMAEAQGVSGNEKPFRRHLEILGRMLKMFDDYPAELGTQDSRLLRQRLEYMLARLVNDRRGHVVKLTADDIRQFLPSISSHDMAKMPPHRKAQTTFRNMLIIGAELECHLRRHGLLPRSLDELKNVRADEQLDADGHPIDYRTHARDWMLQSGGAEQGRDASPWDVYVPCIGRTGGTPTKEVCFASSYSKKRKELFENGVVNDDVPRYRCYMRENVPYRGSQQGTAQKPTDVRKVR